MPSNQVEPAIEDATATRLLARFRTVRAATLSFTAALTPEDLMVQSCADASPLKWHLAHTSWFFETFILTPYSVGYTAFHQDFHWLFNSYYTSLGDMPAKNLRSSFSRPPLDAILAYRRHVDAAIEDLLDTPGEHRDDILARLVLGLEHEQQHLELIVTDIKHAFFTNPLHPAYQESESTGQGTEVELTFSSFPGGLTEIGVTTRRRRYRSLRFRQRDPPAQGLSRALRARQPPRYRARVPRLHRRQRLHPA